MADTILLTDAQILATHINESKDGTKIYRTAYVFVPGAETGYDGKPQVIEMSVMEDMSFNMLRKNIGKSLSLVAEKTTYRDGKSRVQFFAELSEMLKKTSKVA